MAQQCGVGGKVELIIISIKAIASQQETLKFASAEGTNSQSFQNAGAWDLGSRTSFIYIYPLSVKYNIRLADHN